MAHHTKEDCIRLGIPLADIKHRMTRRATWKKYWREGTYGITIHLNEDASTMGLSLGVVMGNVTVLPRLEEYETHPNRDENEKHNENKAPHVQLSPLGMIVDAKIKEVGTHLHEENMIVTHHVCMPTHIHCKVVVSKPLPMVKWGNRMERYHLGRWVQNFKAGITACYRRLQAGESIESILANATAPSPLLRSEENMNEQKTYAPQPSIWAPNYNDKILMNPERLTTWQTYLCYNPYYWRLRDVYPQLFEHRLHLTIAGTDYSAYGCLFLLRKLDRVQVKCHRYKMDPTERYRLKDRKGQRIPYETTEEFQKQRAELLAACAEGAILVSPVISNGEKAIVYEALELGYLVIKLVTAPIPDKGHANDKDRAYCARGQMLILGPWEIKDANNFATRFGDADSKYAKFHNLNDMAAELCKENLSMKIDRKTLEECRTTPRLPSVP